MIKIVEKKTSKSEICLKILKDLPEWFGIEAAIQDYVSEVKNCTFISFESEGEVVGFVALKENPVSFDMYVLGVLKSHHRMSIGKQLVEYAEEYAKSSLKKYMTVKTLSADHPDPNYQKTRLFYERMGYEHLEVLKTLWDENNPCLYMIKCI